MYKRPALDHTLPFLALPMILPTIFIKLNNRYFLSLGRRNQGMLIEGHYRLDFYKTLFIFEFKTLARPILLGKTIFSFKKLIILICVQFLHTKSKVLNSIEGQIRHRLKPSFYLAIKFPRRLLGKNFPFSNQETFI